ncbi:hypothetical protein MFM001_00570 [Mycobacterium sp. MFM001]|uniref:DUF7159 family protein n=1 Tax=Mycobacterium sp. MFM001 TaxID=2049453 RepID=UPI000DA5703C|nr:hypothetical protein [Mycobacterium sp. MFM001]GBE63595.1 hypothetical protein MFM001_00570 [Mycobacterium sp. MFM001]
MDIVLGVSMAPTAVRMVLVEGEDADGVVVEQECFEVGGSAPASAPEQVIAAILGTREGAAEGGSRLMSTGVTWTDPREVGALRNALSTRDLRNVMLVSPLLAAAALAQTVGHALGYEYTALLFVEAESATLAVVDTSDGSIVNLHRQQVTCSPYTGQAAADLATMVERLDGLETRPSGVFIVGCGVDIFPIKHHLEVAAAIPVSVAEEPDMALAHGAALASANAPLFASSTAALAYALDPGTGEVNRDVLAPAYLDVCADAVVDTGALAYSAVQDDDDVESRPHRPLLVIGSGVAALLLISVVALVISLAADVRPTVGQQPPSANGSVAVPTKQAPPKPPPAAAAPSTPAAPPPPAPPPPSAAPPPPAPSSQAPETITEPAPVVRQAPQRVANPAPVHQAPPRQAPAYVPPAAPQEAPPPAAPPPPPPAAPPPAPPAPQMPPMTMYLHLPFVTVPIPINPPPPPAPPPGP